MSGFGRVDLAGRCITANAIAPGLRGDINRVKDAIRQGYAWPGGYEIIAITSDGGLLCNDCMRSEYPLVLDSMRTGSNDGWRIVGLGYEAVSAECARECDPDLVSHCACCNKELGECSSSSPFNVSS